MPAVLNLNQSSIQPHLTGFMGRLQGQNQELSSVLERFMSLCNRLNCVPIEQGKEKKASNFGDGLLKDYDYQIEWMDDLIRGLQNTASTLEQSI